MLRGWHRPEAPVLLTLFPPKPAPGELRGWSTYYLATAGQVLGTDPALVDWVATDLRERPGHSLGLIVNEPLPVPADWGSRPEHFNSPRFAPDGAPLTTEQRQTNREQRCRAWAMGDPRAFRPRQWGASAEHIAPCRWLFAECDHEAMSADDQLALAAAVFGAAPTFSVSTGGKSIHCYFALSGPITPARFTELQRLVIATYLHLDPAASVDSSLSKPNQVLRLAGGLHPRTGALSAIHTASNSILDADALEARLRGLLPPPPPPRTYRPRPSSPAPNCGPVTMEQVRNGLQKIPPFASGQGQREEFIRFVGGFRAVVLEAGGSEADALALALEHSPGVLDVEMYWAFDWTRITAGSFWYQAGGAPKRGPDWANMAGARSAACGGFQ